MSDTDRLIQFMREEAANATDERELWFAATGDALERESAENSRLKEVLGHAELAITSLDPDQLGHDPDGGWPYRDELLHRIQEALVSTGLTKAAVCPKTATEKDGINDRGSDQYASPCTHFSKMSINGQVQCYDCGKYFDDE